MKTRGGRILFALLSGVLAAVSFPKFNLSFFIWISLIPLFLILIRNKSGTGFFYGLLAGFAYYAVILYWIPSVPAHYGNLSPVLSILIYLLLVFYLALYWAAFGFLFSAIHRKFPGLAFLAAPFIWTGLEYGITYVFTGFPWGLLGYTQSGNLPFLQTAAVAGVYGLSFLIVLLQSAFVLSIVRCKRAPFFAALALILAVHSAGFLTLKKVMPSKQTFPAAVIQGNVSSDIYWEAMSQEEIFKLFDHHLDLSRQAYEQGARLIIWPEFTVPLCFSCPEGFYQTMEDRLIGFVRETQSSLLLGTNETAGQRPDILYYNTVLALHPDLSQSRYYKMHLVPFGEYTPYKKIFSFIESVTHAIGDVTPGTQPVLHEFRGVRFGSPICYEVIFPNLVRTFVRKGAGFLVTITNDGWYGTSPAPYQHFLIAAFRAVENRRFLLRAATTGISGVVDPYGRILSRSRLMTSDVLNADVTPSETLTFYTRTGDILPLVSLTLTAALFMLAVFKKAT